MYKKLSRGKVMNKKLKEAIDNIGMTNVESAMKGCKDEGVEVHAEMPLVMADHYAESEKAKKHFQKVMEESEKVAKEITPEDNPSPTVKLDNIYTKLTLDESLFESASLKEDASLSPESTDQKPGFEDWPEDEKAAKAESKKFLGKWISELDEGDYDLYNTLYYDLVHNPSAAGANIPGPKGYSATSDTMLKDQDAQISSWDDGIKVKGKDDAALEKAKKIANRYRDYGVFYETRDFDDRQGYYTKELYIYVPSMDDYDRDPEKLRTRIDIEAERKTEKLTEAAIIKDMSLEDYESSEQGQETLDQIKEAGKIEQLDDLITEMYPNGVNETTLDDLLSYESDWLFDMLGMSKAEDSDETDEVDADSADDLEVADTDEEAAEPAEDEEEVEDDEA